MYSETISILINAIKVKFLKSSGYYLRNRGSLRILPENIEKQIPILM